ncbi:hypothetical protein KPH14_010107 [Odynerus spinipes]|uniref:Protein argonaute-2 n=1 Tax=Odynerus spinipes TaxID=1348599 RepID=A0AAD9RT32_9HYME|nr:hypothetical protein KPH14_010107 [Odynerus spinipes]
MGRKKSDKAKSLPLEQSSSGPAGSEGGRGRGEGGRGRGDGEHGRGDGGHVRAEGGRGRGEGGYDRGEGGRGRGESGRGRGEGGYGRDESGHGRGESGRGRGESGRGRGEGGYDRGEGGYGRDESGRGRGEGGRGRAESGRGRGEGGYDRGEGGRGRGESGHGRGESGRGRGEGGYDRGEGGRGRAEGGRGRGESRRGRGESGRGRGEGELERSESRHRSDPPLPPPASVWQRGESKHEKEVDQPVSKQLEQKKEEAPLKKDKAICRMETSQQPRQEVTTTQQPSALQEKIPRTVVAEFTLGIPTRQNPNICGTLGRKITVEANVMALEFSKLKTAVSQYDVTITADPPTAKMPKFLMRPVFEAFRQKYFSKRFPAFDGRKIAYSASDLPFGRHIQDQVTIFDQERQQERLFTVEMTKTANLDLSFLRNVGPGFSESLGVQSSIQALDVILRHGPLSYCIPVGRSIFWDPGEGVYSLANGLDLWVGSFTSAILGWKPLFNVDVAHKGFPKAQGVIEVMKELCSCGPERDITANDVNRNKITIEKFLKKLKVHYEIPNVPSSKRTQEVNGLVDCPRNYTFSRSDGTKCTIEEYFRIDKRYSIRYPLLPCLWIGPKNKKICVPPELCKIIAGQVINKKMDDKQTREMIKYAATSTTKRKQKIMDGFRALRLNDNPTMKNEFNLSVRAEFEKVPARVLNPPKLEYNKSIVSVTRGTWRAGKFLNASILDDNTWTIVNLGARYIRDREMYSLRDGLQNGATSVGMSIGKPVTPFRSLHLHIRDVINYFTEMKEQKLKLVIVIIPEHDADAYSIVKQVTELKVGVLTQCIKSGTVEKKMNAATIGNILLKINSKLNGVNHRISTDIRPKCLSEPCILIGADVTHPSPDSQNTPSIAAVAASFDASAFKYNIEIRLQPPKTEIIEDLSEIIHRQFIFFRRITNKVPKRVIFYRDGVGEGDLIRVINYEISAIHKAFRMLTPDGSYRPPITFLVVQKRHHIRLFPTSQQNSDDRNFNVQAGTIVDTHITHPSHIDFYLVSHASIQGTARPTKYKCICNECNMTEDEIEELTYYLCHMFSRCTRSVSYPAPTYYAHLAAFRARALIQNVPIQLDCLRDEQKKVTVIINDSPMFYV